MKVDDVKPGLFVKIEDEIFLITDARIFHDGEKTIFADSGSWFYDHCKSTFKTDGLVVCINIKNGKSFWLNPEAKCELKEINYVPRMYF